MTNEEYLRTQQVLIGIAQKVEDLDLIGFLDSIDLADTIGPITAPTLAQRLCGLPGRRPCVCASQ